MARRNADQNPEQTNENETATENAPEVSAETPAADSDAAPVALSEREWNVNIFVGDDTTKRGYKKASSASKTGTIRDLSKWLDKQLTALADGKAAQIVRLEIRAADETESGLDF